MTRPIKRKNSITGTTKEPTKQKMEQVLKELSWSYRIKTTSRNPEKAIDYRYVCYRTNPCAQVTKGRSKKKSMVTKE
jgi:hypothetical protein